MSDAEPSPPSSLAEVLPQLAGKIIRVHGRKVRIVMKDGGYTVEPDWPGRNRHERRKAEREANR